MKFETNVKEVFKPVKIVLESQDEVDYLYALVAATTHEIDEMLEYPSWNLFEFLQERVSQAHTEEEAISLATILEIKESNK